jgi:hypothetical protein
VLAEETDVLGPFYGACVVGFREDMLACKSLLDTDWERVEKID